MWVIDRRCFTFEQTWSKILQHAFLWFFSNSKSKSAAESNRISLLCILLEMRTLYHKLTCGDFTIRTMPHNLWGLLPRVGSFYMHKYFADSKSPSFMLLRIVRYLPSMFHFWTVENFAVCIFYDDSFQTAKAIWQPKASESPFCATQ